MGAVMYVRQEANTWATEAIQRCGGSTSFATGLAVRLMGLAKASYRRPGGLGEAFPRSEPFACPIRLPTGIGHQTCLRLRPMPRHH